MTLLAVREEQRAQIQRFSQQMAGEIVVFCPKCKALQTVQIDESRLMPTRKFHQKGTHIYHDCGATQPCRLYSHM